MRYLKTLGLVVLAVALLNPGASRATQNGAPGGNYVQTCRDIRANGDVLEARCQTQNGDWNETSLRNYNQCTSGIENINGRLDCGKATNGRRQGLPEGGYVKTCRDIQTNGNTLTATCETRNGGSRQTSLSRVDRCRSSIENNNGRLTCSR